MNLEWIILVTDRFSESYGFYKKILGLPVVREIPEENFIQFRLVNCFLAVYGRKELEELVGKKYITKGGGAIYTFAEVDNLDKEYKRLINKGVKFFKPPEIQPWGQKTAYFTDPDGHIWEIQSWIKK